MRPTSPTHSMTTRNEGQRVLDGQRAMQLSSDPLLGFARGRGRDYLVRQLNDHKASLDLYALSEAHFLALPKLLPNSSPRDTRARVIRRRWPIASENLIDLIGRS
jgi:hypothetical protein